MTTVGANEDLEARRTDLSRMLIRLRKSRGVSQAQLARMASAATPGKTISDGFIGRIEAGERGASLETLDVLATALHLSNAELVALYEAAGIDFGDGGSADRIFADPAREITPGLEGFPTTTEARLQALESAVANQSRKLDEILALLRGDR